MLIGLWKSTDSARKYLRAKAVAAAFKSLCIVLSLVQHGRLGGPSRPAELWAQQEPSLHQSSLSRILTDVYLPEDRLLL